MNEIFKIRPDTFKPFFLGYRVNRSEVRFYHSQWQAIGLVEVKESVDSEYIPEFIKVRFKEEAIGGYVLAGVNENGSDKLFDKVISPCSV
ncbi:MAG: hypothetical protein RSB82_02095 [Victivallaceae bacterium]